ncbi:MAG: hypothetical protein RL211_845 [Pseudomonadota bacterium]|jgi:RNA polymerase sigma-54 factor
MKPGLSLRVSQHLALTPQLQQSIKLLQLSTLELSQEVEQMLDDNPFLELAADDLPREEFGLTQADARVQDSDREAEVAAHSIVDYADLIGADSRDSGEVTPLAADAQPDWDGDGTHDMAPDDSEWGGDARAYNNNLTRDDEPDAVELARDQESLQTHLHRQASGLRLSETDRAALHFLIESINADGYLDDPLEDLARSLKPADGEQLQELMHHFTVARALLQTLEPVGVGAHNLAECLDLQLRAMLNVPQMSEAQRARIALAQRICRQPLDLLARRDVRQLMRLCAGTDAQMREAVTLISRLEPRPGRRFVRVEHNIVTPDVLVVKVGRGVTACFRVTLNADVMPRLRVHDIYANALKQHKGGGRDASNFAALQQRLQEARWFIKNIQQRFDTILRVSNAIVDRQKSFFMHGELAMRPLVLREIADELGLHESTISRVTTAKYMATPFGTFELKYFFGSGLGTESGGNASSTAVRALIKQFIAAESPKKPLSDNQISDMLKEQGIECARRTVAKYREGLKIATASLRKDL